MSAILFKVPVTCSVLTYATSPCCRLPLTTSSVPCAGWWIDAAMSLSCSRVGWAGRGSTHRGSRSNSTAHRCGEPRRRQATGALLPLASGGWTPSEHSALQGTSFLLDRPLWWLFVFDLHWLSTFLGFQPLL